MWLPLGWARRNQIGGAETRCRRIHPILMKDDGGIGGVDSVKANFRQIPGKHIYPVMKCFVYGRVTTWPENPAQEFLMVLNKQSTDFLFAEMIVYKRKAHFSGV